jgi:hypothetical protein
MAGLFGPLTTGHYLIWHQAASQRLNINIENRLTVTLIMTSQLELLISDLSALSGSNGLRDYGP